MRRDIKNLAASVHQRLLDRARETDRPFNELLQYFAIERFIYRLSKSVHRNRFILKGALMLPVWSGSESRPTMDIDCLGRMDNDIDLIASVVKDICKVTSIPDGMAFDAESVSATRIAEDTGYTGARIKLRGNLGNARISLQLDIGFGDIVVPGPIRFEYPGFLDFPRAKMKGYTKESTIAEKFHAMVRLGSLNSRIKDFYDIRVLSENYEYKGNTLTEAISRTFSRRNTPVPSNPTIFEPSFGEATGRNAQWRGFIIRNRLDEMPAAFGEIMVSIRKFLAPVASAIAHEKTFRKTWKPPGPWR